MVDGTQPSDRERLELLRTFGKGACSDDGWRWLIALAGRAVDAEEKQVNHLGKLAEDMR